MTTKPESIPMMHIVHDRTSNRHAIVMVHMSLSQMVQLIKKAAAAKGKADGRA
jgi:hypothetical protein